MRELFKVLKDHSNRFMQELVTASYQHCFISEMENILQDADIVDAEECGTENVVRVCLVNPAFKPSLSTAIQKLQSAKLTIDQFGFDSSTSEETPEAANEVAEPGLGDKLTVLINDIAIAMKTLDYALYKGKIHKKCEGAKYTYSYRCDVKAFVNSLAANESFKSRLIRDMKRVIDLLSDSDCEVIRPIAVDYNLIEVNQGYCWSVEERTFLKDPIPPEKVGLITPRAFTQYDPFKEPHPKYFIEILENSLSESQISLFCEDFLRLLKYNQKKHKEKVACLVGDADSGKTSLFYPILGVIHHSNVATITKQKVFNKSMISKETEVIFVDEASPTMLDVDDWKILTQGGFTACDVKYKTARSFFNRCPMFMTAQQKLQFKPEDQQAMDRRLRYYYFKSLPSPKKKAAHWLRSHPKECIVWAASKARISSDDEQESSDDDVGEVQRDKQNDGTLLESEKEVLRTVNFADFLVDQRERPEGEQQSPHDDSDLDDCNGQEDETTAALRASLALASPGTLRYRHISFMLESVETTNNAARDRRLAHQRRMLVDLGVVEESEARELIVDPDDELPASLERKKEEALEQRRALRASKQQKENEEKAKKVYTNRWLLDMENEMAEQSKRVEITTDSEERAVLYSLLEINSNKLRLFHEGQGTLKLKEAVQERKRMCLDRSLVESACVDSIRDVFSPLPVIVELARGGYVNNSDNASEHPSVSMELTPPESERGAENYNDEDDEWAFVRRKPKTPSYTPSFDIPYTCPPSPFPAAQPPAKRARDAQSQSYRSRQQKISCFFSSQERPAN